ncbi:cytochrome P450 [Apiospora saccharicola]|uniref:Cytochrome P450 n=1 Tax=Apiospora saccharicola TaxID=335842 RepID=A0ABR1UG95_9PEZI
MEKLIQLRGQVLSWQNLAILVTIYVVTLSVYRLFLHPLARFPGPKLAAVTRYYEAYFDVLQEGQYTFKIAELHKKYGPIVRISSYELHVNDPAFHEKLYRQEGRWDKYGWAVNAFGTHGASISKVPHDLHKARRQPLNPFFSKTKVVAREDFINRNIAVLCDRLSQFANTAEKTKTVVDLGAAISALSRDVACEFILDRKYAHLERQDFHVGVTNMLQSAGPIWRITKHAPWFGPLVHSIPPGIMMKIADENTRAFFQYLQESERDTKDLLRIAHSSSGAHNEPPSSPRTIVHEIVDSKLPLAEKGFERVMFEVATVTGAGNETTAGVLRLVLYHVFADRAILQRLRAELDDAATLELKALEQLPYLTSVIMEGMRLSPAIGSRSSRIAPDRDLVYGEGKRALRIPAGTPVGMTTILMHTDEASYPEPLSFRSDRGMGLDAGARRRLDKAYAPFSKGTRMCLGMHLAWAEMYLAVAQVVQRFDFEFQGVDATTFHMQSDQFIIKTKGIAALNAAVTLREAC